MKVCCVYHSIDLDGWMSGALAKFAYSEKIDMIGYNYGELIPDLSSYDRIIMVDISFNPEFMFLNKERIIWIDHHISAINDSQKCGYHDIRGLRKTEYAACELAWMFFWPDKKMPDIVRLLGRYDCFGHKGTAEEQKVLQFQYGARYEIHDVDEAYGMLMIVRGRGDWSFDVIS